MLLANYHGRYEPGPVQAKWGAFEPINYACSGIIDGENVVGYLPTPEMTALRVNQAENTKILYRILYDGSVRYFEHFSTIRDGFCDAAKPQIKKHKVRCVWNHIFKV